MMKKRKILLTTLLAFSIASLSSCISVKNNNATTLPETSSSSDTTTSSKVPTEYKFSEVKWADDFSSASLVFKNNIDSFTIGANISKTTINPTCEVNGKIIYTATGIFNDVVYKDTKEVVLNKLEHDYIFDSFEWNGYTAKAKLICKNDNNHIKYENIDVISEITKNPTCDDEGIRLYTAKYNNNTDTKEEILPALDHNYKFDSFVWDESNYTCKAKLVCLNDDNHVIYKDAFVTSKDYQKPDCENEGTITYVASYENQTSVKTVILNKLEHDYIFKSFIWDSQSHTAKAKLICSYNNNHEKEVSAEVLSEVTQEASYTQAGLITYTLKYENNIDYRYEIIPQLEYFDTFVRFDFVDDDAYAIYINEEDPLNEKAYAATVEKEIIKNPTCTETGSYKLTATYDSHTESKIIEVEALGHDYEFDSFIWDMDNYKAQAKLVCLNDNSHIIYVDADISSVITVDATCEHEGNIAYTATYDIYSSSIDVTISIQNHDYIFDSFVWNYEDYTAKAKFICSYNNSHVVEYSASINKETIKDVTYDEDGIIKYTASYGSNSESIEIIIPSVMSNYDFESFEWADDFETAKAIFINKNDSSDILKKDASVVKDITLNPTCTDKGSIKYTAIYGSYNDIKTKEMAELGHDYKFDSFIWNGYTAKARYVCKNNNNHIEEYDATITTKIIKEASYDEDGIIEYIATYDNNTDSITASIPKTASNYNFSEFEWANDFETAKAIFVNKNDSSDIIKKDAIVTKEILLDPTCTTKGNIKYTATYDSYIDTKIKDIDELGHNYQFVSIIWDGYTAKALLVCENDNLHIKYEAASVTSEVTLEPKCSEKGIRTYTATYEGHTSKKTEEIAELGHNYIFDSIIWEEYVPKAKLVCENDNSHVKYEECELSISNSATCTSDGIKTYTATYENHISEKTEFAPKIGHNYITPSYVWTKSGDTYKCVGTSTCSNCGDSLNEEATVSVNKTLATKDSIGSVTYTATFTNPIFVTQTKTFNLYYVSFVDYEGNATSSTNEYFDVEENSIITYTPVKVGSKTYNNPIISTSGNNTLTYAFVGWTIDDNLVNVSTYKVTKNTIFKPKYVKYEMKSNIDGAATLMGLAGDQYTTQSQISLYRSINEGYVFVGWYKIIDGVETAIVEASTLDSGNMKRAYLNETSDTIYLAKFIELPLDITYDDNKGSISIEATDGNEEGLWIGRTIKVSAITIGNNIFTGFYDNDDELVYKNGDIPLSSFNVTINALMDTINLEARFVESFINISVNSTKMGEVIGTSDTLVYGEIKEFVANAINGYSFDGWYKNGTFYSSSETISLKIVEVNSGTYEARFTSYTVTTVSSDMAAGTITDYTNHKVEAGALVTLTAEPNEGYTFLGWYSNDVRVSPDLVYTFNMPKANVSLEARFASYTLTTSNLNPQYGDVSIYNKTVTANTNVTLTATPKKGYTFLGWFDLSDNSRLTDLLSYDLLMPYNDVSYEARFAYYTLTANAKDDLGVVTGDSTSNIVEVTFNKNGGTGNAPTQYVSNVDTLKYPDEITKAGYVFTGWYSDIECTNLYDFTATLNKNITLYAGFIKQYESNYNNQEVVDFTRLYNANNKYYTLSLANSSETKTNNIYFTSYVDGNINVYIKTKTSIQEDQLHASIINLTTGMVYNTSIYSDSINYVLKQLNVKKGDVICITNYIESNSTDAAAYFYVTGNQLPSDGAICGDIVYNNAKITADTKYTLYATPNLGYTFDGWYINNEKVSSNQTETFTKKKENEVVEARFICYTVTVSASYKNDDSNAGEIINEYNLTKVTVGEDVNLKASLTEGYTFLGWYNGDNLVSSDLEYTFKMPKNNINYVAKYTYYTLTIESNNSNAGTYGGVSDSNYVIVKFNSNSSDIYDDQIVKKQAPLSYPGNPYKEGYVFTGWYTDTTYTELFDFTSYIKENITLYAGYYEINFADAKDVNSLDITKTAFNNETAVNISEAGSSTTSANYTFISILVSGTYRFSYKNSSDLTDNGVFMEVYNVTKGLYYYYDGPRLINTSYTTFEFEANAGDVIYVKTYAGSANAASTFSYFFTQKDGDNTIISKTPVSTATCGALTYSNTKITKGSHVLLQATVNAGYEFLGWYKVDNSIETILTDSLTYEITISEYENGTYLAKYKLAE